MISITFFSFFVHTCTTALLSFYSLLHPIGRKTCSIGQKKGEVLDKRKAIKFLQEGGGSFDTRESFQLWLTHWTFFLLQTSVCNKIVELLKETYSSGKIAIVCQNDFYKSLTTEEQNLAEMGNYNFDHPGDHNYILRYNLMDDYQV